MQAHWWAAAAQTPELQNWLTGQSALTRQPARHRPNSQWVPAAQAETLALDYPRALVDKFSPISKSLVEIRAPRDVLAGQKANSGRQPKHPGPVEAVHCFDSSMKLLCCLRPPHHAAARARQPVPTMAR